MPTERYGSDDESRACRTVVEETDDDDASKMQTKVSYSRLDAMAQFLGRRVSRTDRLIISFACMLVSPAFSP